MNTMAEFYEWCLHHEHELSSVKTTTEKEQHEHEQQPEVYKLQKNRYFELEDEDDPSLTASEDSSLTDISSYDSCCDELQLERSPSTASFANNSTEKKHLTFSDTVQVREYQITVCHHPFCEDHLALSLDWKYAEAYTRHINTSKVRKTYYDIPPRLSVEERAERLKEVAGYTDEVIQSFINPPTTRNNNNPICNFVEMLQNSWIKLLPEPDYSDPDEEDETETETEESSDHNNNDEIPFENATEDSCMNCFVVEDETTTSTDDNVDDDVYDTIEQGLDDCESSEIIHWTRNHPRSMRRKYSFCV